MSVCPARTGRLACAAKQHTTPCRCGNVEGHVSVMHWCPACRRHFGAGECAPPYGEMEPVDLHGQSPDPTS